MEFNTSVLIVDDDPLVRKTLSDILLSKGYRVLNASTGAEAMSRVSRNDPLITLIDLRLEDMPGLDVIRRIKEISPQTECIVLTGYATQSSAIEAVNLGAYSYFQKPYDMDQLLITIRRASELIEMESQRTLTMQALKESELRFRVVSEMTSDFAYSLEVHENGDLEYEWMTDALPRATGYTFQELRDLGGFENIVFSDDRLIAENRLARLMAGEQTMGDEFRITTREGALRWVTTSGKPTTDEVTGRVVRIYNAIQDIHERKRAEEQHQRLLDQQIVINRFALALGETSDLTRTYQTIYRYISELLQVSTFIVSSYTPDTQLISAEYIVSDGQTMDVCEFPPIPLEPEGQGTQSRVIRSGKPWLIGDYRREVVKANTQYVIVDGESVVPGGIPEEEENIGPHSALLVPMQVEGETVGVVQVQSSEHNAYSSEDIDLLMGLANVAAIAIQNARLLLQARDQAQQVHEIIESVPEGVVLLTSELHVLLMNPIAEKMIAKLAGDVHVGDKLVQLADRNLAEFLSSPPEGLWHLIETRESKAGYYEVIARPVEGGLQNRGWVLVLRDVTREREVQSHIQQQERLAALGQLAAGIAHDFNNIMAIIVLYAQMSRNINGLPVAIYERLDVIGDQAKHATSLISQILDFSRSSVLKRSPLDLGEFIQGQIALLDRTLPDSIRMVTNFNGSKFMISADPTRIQQMVMNLAVNARDAMPDGGVLSIELEHISIGRGTPSPLPDVGIGEWVKFTVSDTGTGIPADTLTHIFDPFFTTKAPGKGTGLGLSQAHGIVKQHGGEIGVESVVGVGTKFVIYLPILHVAYDSPNLITQPPVKGNQELILVVEDNIAVRKALTSTLQALDYRFIEASNGKEALAVFDDNRFDIRLVISDLVMPEMGGKALARAIREKAIDVPIILASGHVRQSDIAELREIGVAGWIQKPPTLDGIANALANALGENNNHG